MSDIKAYNEIKGYLKKFDATLVAVSKTKSAEDITRLYQTGQRLFGENYVQELTVKYEKLPKDIEWHFIGHLQTNKVKYIAHFIHTIQSVDSMKLLQEIDKQAKRNNRVIKCLLEIHVAKEETKFGLTFDEARQILLNDEVKKLTNIKIKGLMGMASLTNDENQLRKEFHLMKVFFEEMNALLPKTSWLNTLSIGMSSDYKAALNEGSTMVRIGSLIFGERR